MEMKSALKRIPTKDEMSIHSNYDQIIEYYWFNGYADFLKFLGENTLHVKKPLEISTTTSTSKEDIIEEDSKFLKKNGSRDLFDKILCEGEFKYTVNFGSVSEYLKILFPQDKKMMLNMWDDRKKDFNSDNCP